MGDSMFYSPISCPAMASISSRLNRTLTMYGAAPGVQWPYVVATKVPSGSTSTPG